MNTRIKELVQEAKSYALVQNDLFGEDYDQTFLSKFAELVVKDCANAADMANDAGCECVGDYVAEYMGYGEEEGVAAWREDK